MRLTRTELVAELPLLKGALFDAAVAWMEAHPHPLWLRPLVAVAGDSNRSGPERAAAAQARARIGEVLAQEPIALGAEPVAAAGDALLAHADASMRRAAARAFATRGEGAAGAALLAALRREQDPGVLLALAGAAVAVGGAKGIAGLSTLLAHADAGVRCAAVDALGAIRDEAVLGRCLSTLSDADARVSLVAARVVSTFKAPALLAAIDAALEGSDARAAAGALYALRFFAPGEAVRRLTNGLLRREKRERRTAALSLAALVASAARAPASGHAAFGAAFGGKSAATKVPTPQSAADSAALAQARELVRGMGWDRAEHPALAPWAPALDPVTRRPLEAAAGPLKAWLVAAEPEAGPGAWSPDEARIEVDRLSAMLAEPDLARRATAALLGALGPVEAWRAHLEPATRAGRPEVATHALARSGAAALSALMDALSRGQPAAADALVELSAGELAPQLDALAASESPSASVQRLARSLRGVDAAAASVAASAGGAVDEEPAPDARQLAAFMSAGQVTPARLRRWLPAQRVPAAIISLLKLARELDLPDRAELAGPFVSSPELSVRQAGLELFIATPGKAADESLYLLIQDREEVLARQAFDALCERSRETAGDSLAPLLASGKPPLIRRGMLFLESLNDPSRWRALIEVCRQPMGEGIPEEVARLLAAWLPGGVLEELETLHHDSSGLLRRGLKAVALIAGARLGVAVSELNARFPEPAKKSVVVRHPEQLARDAARSRQRAAAAVVSALAVFSGLAMWLSSPGPGTSSIPAPVHVSRPASTKRATTTPGTAVNPSTPRSLPPVRSGSASDVLADVLAGQKRASLGSVEKQVAAELGAMGIRSRRLIRAVALERVEEKYKTRMKSARQVMSAGSPLQAIPILEALLAEQDKDHHFARVEIIKLAIGAAVRAKDYKEARRLQDLLKAEKAAWLALVVEAASDAGADAGGIQAFKAAYEAREETRDQALHVATMFRPAER